GLALLALAFVRRPLLDAAAAVGGISVSAGALAALLISEHTPLFGFMEQGYRLEIVIAIASEALAISALTVFVVGRRAPLRGRRRGRRGGGTRGRAGAGDRPGRAAPQVA